MIDPDSFETMAKDAREHGFVEMADWMEGLAKAERRIQNRFDAFFKELTDVIDQA